MLSSHINIQLILMNLPWQFPVIYYEVIPFLHDDVKDTDQCEENRSHAYPRKVYRAAMLANLRENRLKGRLLNLLQS